MAYNKKKKAVAKKTKKKTTKKVAKKVSKKTVAKKKVTKKVTKKVSKKKTVAKKKAKKLITKVDHSPKASVTKKKAKKKVVKKAPRATTKDYLPNRDLFEEVKRCLIREEMSDVLAKQLQLLVGRYGRKANWAGYTYNEDMQAYAMMMLVRTWKSFNPKKSQNPFAFFTQCIKNSFIQYWNQEKRQRIVKDEIAVDRGLDPSYTYQLQYADEQKALREEVQEEEQDTREEEDLLSY